MLRMDSTEGSAVLTASGGRIIISFKLKCFGEKNMKAHGKTCIILGVVFILLSLMWFFWIESTVTGILWLTAGIVELIAAMRYLI